MLVLPPIIDPHLFLSKSKFKKKQFIDVAYDVFKNDFIKNPVCFKNTVVRIQPKKLDCSNCGNKCTNDFSCSDCPYADKEDIFQHITSFEDANLLIDTEYAKKRRKKKKQINTRTPGKFDISRTKKIPWIKPIIENKEQDSSIAIKIKPDKFNKKINRILIYHRPEDFMIVLSEHYKKQFRILYLNSAYDNASNVITVF